MSVDREVRTIRSPPDDRYPRRLLLTVIAAIVVFSSSMTIVSASLPTMADDLDSTESFLSWSVTGLFLMMAVGTPVLGRLGDSLGHRRVFLTGRFAEDLATELAGRDRDVRPIGPPVQMSLFG